MSRLKREMGTTDAQNKEIAWGPCFEIVREQDANWRKGVCILSDHEPTDDEIRATAEATVRRWNLGYRCKHFWRCIVEPEPASFDGLTGAPARLEAERRMGRLAASLAAPSDIRARPKQFPDDEFDEFLKGDTP